jgi:dTDP-4-dehydrorhamnose 3,5-epimerase
MISEHLKTENKIEKTELDGVFKVKLEKFNDDRGSIFNLYDNKYAHFNLEKLTISKKNVLRGLHSDLKNDKLIYCLRGSFFFVVVNYIKESSQYLKKIELQMTEDSDFAVFVPKGFLNGHYCLEENTYFYYKWSDGYIPANDQISVRWDSPSLAINWNLLSKEPIISDRDKKSILI